MKQVIVPKTVQTVLKQENSFISIQILFIHELKQENNFIFDQVLFKQELGLISFKTVFIDKKLAPKLLKYCLNMNLA